MRVSLWNFKDWYEKHGVGLSYFISDNSASITMLSAGEAARQGCAVVQLESQSTDFTGFHTALRFGSNRILFPVASPVEVLNLGNAMIEHISLWENRLLDLVTDGCSVEQILEFAQEEFPFPMALLRTSGAVEYRTGDWAAPLDEKAARRLVRSALQRQSAAPPFFNTIFINQSYTYLSDTVKTGGVVPYVLIACEGETRLQPGDIHLFHKIAETLQDAIRFHGERRGEERSLRRWYETFTREGAFQSHGLSGILQDALWQEEEFYLTAALSPEKEGSPLSLPDLLPALTGANHCCVGTEYGLSVLIRLGPEWQAGLAREEARMREVFSGERVSIGLSLPFFGFSRLPAFYRQSLCAMEAALEGGALLLSCRDALPELIRNACQDLPGIRSLLRPDLLLAERDSREGEALLKTLYTYLMFGCSSSKTAEVLGIHRNTLRKRLEILRALVPADYTKPDIQERLLLSMLALPA